MQFLHLCKYAAALGMVVATAGCGFCFPWAGPCKPGERMVAVPAPCPWDLTWQKAGDTCHPPAAGSPADLAQCQGVEVAVGARLRYEADQLWGGFELGASEIDLGVQFAKDTIDVVYSQYCSQGDAIKVLGKEAAAVLGQNNKDRLSRPQWSTVGGDWTTFASGGAANSYIMDGNHMIGVCDGAASTCTLP